MKQIDIATALGVTKDHFNAVVCGRADAGKKLAVRASIMIGGSVETWMMENHRASRRRIFDRFSRSASGRKQRQRKPKGN
jgi:plasmid maintenance system antidote protein VapI